MSNDRLKFRAWDDENLCWVRPKMVENESGVTVDERGYELFQWSGLYDSDGHEMYRGSIIAIVDKVHPKPTIYREILFHEGGFMISENEWCDCWLAGCNSSPDTERFTGSHCCFVVGDIMKTPELLDA